jgi:hypothetical protein
VCDFGPIAPGLERGISAAKSGGTNFWKYTRWEILEKRLVRFPWQTEG